MKLFGREIFTGQKSASPVSQGSGWRHIVHEAFAGAWQHNIEVKIDDVLSYPAVFACQSLIATDISKLRVKLVAKDEHGIWKEVEDERFSPVLEKPNHWQNRIQFFESWVLSKLQRGNTYCLKRRDSRGKVVGLFVLNPDLVQPMVSDSGEVFYQLRNDRMSGIQNDILVPADEIIHDRFNCFYHPLVGLSPIYANGLAATQGKSIMNSSTRLFLNGARPSGVLSAPAAISDGTAKRLKEYWETEFTGRNSGKVAVLGDGLKYEAMTMTSSDAQVVEQLGWSTEVVCSTYHVPPYKIGHGQMPSYNNVEALNVEYYSQCLQGLIESIELCLDEGLQTGNTFGSSRKMGTEFDISGLIRMDGSAQMERLEKSKGKMTVNEQRKELELAPVDGGDTVYLQEQDHSIEWLQRRDAMPIEAPAPPAPAPDPSEEPEEPAEDEETKAIKAQLEAMKAIRAMSKGLQIV